MKLSECVWLRASNNVDEWKPEPAPSDWSCDKWCNVEDAQFAYRICYVHHQDQIVVVTHDKQHSISRDNYLASVLELAAFLVDKRPI